MDPLTAFGLASNVVAFIDFGCSLVSSAVEVYNSVDGTTADTTDLLSVISRLEHLSGELVKPALAGERYAGLQKLSQGCHGLSLEFLHILRSLQVAKRGFRRSLGVAWRAWRKRSDIESIRRRLDEYRNLMLLELNLLFKYVSVDFGVNSRPHNGDSGIDSGNI